MNAELEETRPAALACMTQLSEGLQQALRSTGMAQAAVYSRVKSSDAVRHKLERVPGSRVNDFIGLRLVLPHQGYLEEAVTLVGRWAGDMGMETLGADDRFASPGVGGYRAVHLDFAILDPEARGLTPEIGVEVQVTTVVLAAHAALCHELAYHVRRDEHDPNMADRLAELGEDAAKLDREIAALSGMWRAD